MIIVLVALIAGLVFVFPATVLGAEPKAGDVINASNAEPYKEYLPSYLERFVKDG